MTEREKFISWVLGLKDSNGEYLYSPAKLRSEFVDGAWQFSCIQVAAMWQGWLSAHQAHTSTQHRAALEECVREMQFWESAVAVAGTSAEANSFVAAIAQANQVLK